MIRTSVSDISVLGRITSGVKVMNLEEGVKVASFSKVKNDDRPEEASDDKYDSEEAADDKYDSEEAADGEYDSEEAADDKYDSEEAADDKYDSEEVTENKPYVDKGIDELIQRAEDDSDK